MSVEERIDDLIEAGWAVLDSDFDQIAFHRWRRSAFDCLTDMLGPEHYYTKHFATVLRTGEQAETLAAVGILSAAQQQMAGNRQEPAKADGYSKSVPALIEKTGGSIDRSEQVDQVWRDLGSAGSAATTVAY